MTDTLFTIVTHKSDRMVCRHIERVGSQLRDGYKFLVYYDATSGPDLTLPIDGYQTLSFDFKKIRTNFPQLVRAPVAPGNQYATYVDLLHLYPEVKYFWFVEYDVRFSGNWCEFVDTCNRSRADMLGLHIRRREEIPDWDWWPSIRNEIDPKKELPGIRAFQWVSRLSRDALNLIAKRCMEDGWTGHMEALVPSLLYDAGMRIEEIGGRGPFTPEERRGLYYSSENVVSSPSHNGDLGLGSNRFSPPLFLWGIRKNRIYHPVKTDRSLRTIRLDVLSSLKYKKDSAVDLLKRAARHV